MEDLQSRISLNTMCLTQVRLFNAVDFGQLDALFFEYSGRLFVVRSKRLAVPTPWREEFDEDEFLRVNDRLEVGGSQVDDIGGTLGKNESSE
jgi:hypothetical protein